MVADGSWYLFFIAVAPSCKVEESGAACWNQRWQSGDVQPSQRDLLRAAELYHAGTIRGADNPIGERHDGSESSSTPHFSDIVTTAGHRGRAGVK